MIATVTQIGPRLGIVPTCAALGLPAEQRVAARAAVLATAYGAHTERFPGGLPQPPTGPTEVWINPPNAPVRSHAASRSRSSDLPTRPPSRSLPSIAAQPSRL